MKTNGNTKSDLYATIALVTGVGGVVLASLIEKLNVFELQWQAYIEKEDTLAQWIAAFAAAFLLVTSIITIIYLSKTLSATRQGNITAKSMAQDQSRAYASVESVSIEEEGSSPYLVFCLVNSGQTPAKNCQITVSVSSDIPGMKLEDEPIFNLPGGNVPKQITSKNNNSYIDQFFDGISGKSEIKISGKLSYETIFDEKFISEFSFLFGRKIKIGRHSAEDLKTYHRRN